MTSYSRQDVLRILQISSHQLQGWERAGLIPQQQTYTFQDLGQLRTLRAAARGRRICGIDPRFDFGHEGRGGNGQSPARGLRGAHRHRLAFRHRGAMVDPIRRQLLFDFERAQGMEPPPAVSGPAALRSSGRSVQDRFLAAVQAEENGEKQCAIALYEEILEIDPGYAAACINLGTLFFHLRQYGRAEELYRRATEVDPSYVLAYFDLGNVLDELERLDESIAAYRRAIAFSPRYADAHYNLALAYERKGLYRSALRHWQTYVRLDNRGPWADHARAQIRKLLSREKLSIAWRASKLRSAAQRNGFAGTCQRLAPLVRRMRESRMSSSPRSHGLHSEA